ncbi:anti-sigma factor family protein [Flavihumibacter petaseus]|nr:hypothetical protein [Flavihumibacter petaseus]
MNEHPSMDSLLWEYIDGHLSAAERSTVENLIANDKEWKQKYEDLLQFSVSLGEDISLEEPSLRFNRNVMEEIMRHHIAPATGSYINKKIIFGIGGFFLLLIVGFLVYAFGQINWTIADSGTRIPFKVEDLHLERIFNNTYINIFILVNIVLALVLLDRYLAHQKKQWKKQG